MKNTFFFLCIIKKPQAILLLCSIRSIANKKQKYSNIFPLFIWVWKLTDTTRTYVRLFSVWNSFGIPWHWSFRWYTMLVCAVATVPCFVCVIGQNSIVERKKTFFSQCFSYGTSNVRAWNSLYFSLFQKCLFLFYLFR